jgi:BirA family transcriptional regulator, biotin operon repressor / biotin---[acetyl-CoA-carboxylase] ligase
LTVSESDTRAETPLAARVYAQLARGGFHSGAELARELEVTRSAVWKAAVSLRDLGIVVHAVRNRGYRLRDPCEPLDAARRAVALSPDTRARVRRIETVWRLESTNATLLERTDVPAGRADVLLAEYQTAGRGRRGRPWIAPPGGAICLSLGWTFLQLPRDFAALGLAVGVCALRALRPHARSDIGLKWPNDLVIEGRKLGGILIEMRAESGGPSYVVVGIGINIALGAQLKREIAATGTEAADLAAGGDLIPRNVVAAHLIEQIIKGLIDFEDRGLRPFVEEWRSADSLRGQPVSVHTATEGAQGIARGIDLSGALLLETPTGLRKFVSGDVSVRPES